MKKRTLLLLLCTAMITTSTYAQKIKITTGIEVLKQTKFKAIAGKSVGLITNPTGVDNNLKSTIDILHEAPSVNLVALYGPEHGVRGDVHAGDKIETFTDSNTAFLFILFTEQPENRLLKCWKESMY